MVSFERVAVVNRGEPAMRFIHAAAEMNWAGEDRLTTIALYTEPERDALFVREADEAVCIGPAMAFDARLGRRAHSYLDYERLERALEEARAEAVWVGWGFVAEHADFVELCERRGITFIGPRSDVMRRLGDKIGAKRLAEEAGVPVAPWSGGPVADLDEAYAAAERIGYPLLVKAAAGGGGRGIRGVTSAADLDAAFEAARTEAQHAFGDPTLFLERQVLGARHVEIQVIADQHGTVWAAGLRDCTLQRRNQKVIEESSCTLLDADQDRDLRAAGARLCREAGYTNAGTVEFLYSPEDRSFSFMEVNARLQVEHPVTELTTGLDLVKLQIKVARGEALEGDVPPVNGHAMEARLNAEDPDNGFAPAPGRIRLFRPPTGPGIRVDTGVTEGDEISPHFDSMIAKVLAWGRDRDEARSRLARALAQTPVIVEGGRTNKPFLLTLLGHPDVLAGDYDTRWLDRHMADGDLLERAHADVALLVAAAEAYEAEHEMERRAFYAAAARGRPTARPETQHEVEFHYRGHSYSFSVYRLIHDVYRIDTGGSTVDITVERPGTYERRVTVGGRHHRVMSAVLGPVHTVEVDGIPHTIARDEGGVVRAPAPAMVVSIAVAPGDEVAVGTPLAVVESMKMETVIVAEFPGRVQTIVAAANVQVDRGAPLMLVEPLITGGTGVAGRQVTFDFASGGGADRAAQSCHQAFESLRSYLLGYDLDPTTARHLVSRQEAICAEMPVDDAEVMRHEHELLSLFADLCAISRREPDPTEDQDVMVRAPEEYLLTCLRTFDRDCDALPAAFVERLRRVLALYGVEEIERTPKAEEALMRIYQSQQRLAELVPAIVTTLDRRVVHAEQLLPLADDGLRTVLDHLITATDGRYQVVSDLARDVRYRYFEQPVLAEARARVYAAMDAHLEALQGDADGADGPEHADRTDRAGRIDAIIACPQPMRPPLLRWYRDGNRRAREVVVEVATRRYYRIRQLEELTVIDAAGQPMAAAGYDHNGMRVHLNVAYGAAAELPALVRAIAGHLRDVPAAHEPVVDIHLWQPGELGEADAAADHFRRILDETGFGRPMHRIDVTVTADPVGQLPPVTYHFTYRQVDGKLAEEMLYRNLHPMLAKRLNIGLLQNFDITRLHSAEDVYLFHGVAHANPKDQRLFALAEVRDLTPVRDDEGRIVSFPLLERTLAEALSGIRQFQSRRPVEKRLLENLLILYIRPTWTESTDLWRELAHKLAPATRGLAIERVVARVRLPDPIGGGTRETALHVTHLGPRGVVVEQAEPDQEPIQPLPEYRQKVLQTQRRGGVYPYELIKMMTPPAGTPSDFPSGDFVEHDLDGDGRLVPVDRPYGQNTANLVVGIIRNATATVPEGMSRVLIAGDPSRSLGSLAEAECRRIMAALDLAERLQLPVEWFAVSSGARIAMTSGTENMDWIGAVLGRLVQFTQGGGEVNIIVTGINVGAQPYWNAEATMLMHTKGILVMMPESAMVLTGKQALDFSGGVSAEDNLGIGGFERIMGPNGQGQYWAPDLESACEILLRHYDHTYVVPGERFPRRAATTDPFERDVRRFPHADVEDSDFVTVGDVFSAERNPERKKPFDVRSVMRAVTDQDHVPLERWRRWRHADTGVVWDARIGGIPVSLLGFESRIVPREGFVPGDGPGAWTSGTLFPQSSKKIARAINSASNNRPLVVLANLSGFDGSPESMRTLQLEYGAEIGRAVTNFVGPIVFAVISRYHGGAFVVFSKRLNGNMEVVAVEGSYASVIGGAPAAAVVFARDVDARTKNDPRVVEALAAVQAASDSDGDRQRAAQRLQEVTEAVHAEKLGQVAQEFDTIHSVERALEVGSVDRIIPAAELRPYLVEALERGMARELERAGAAPALPVH